MKYFCIALTIIYLLGCQSLQENEKKINIKQFSEIIIGITKKIEVERMLGKPDKVNKERWGYRVASAEKMWIAFKDNKVSSVSMSVWESDEIRDVELLLQSFLGNWVVFKEPMSNPHSAPSLCYLEDLDQGKRVRINGYGKTVEHIAKWKPEKTQKSIKEYLYSNVGKEFCVADHCSKVTNPTAWKHNHCEWLKKIVNKVSKPEKKSIR